MSQRFRGIAGLFLKVFDSTFLILKDHLHGKEKQRLKITGTMQLLSLIHPSSQQHCMPGMEGRILLLLTEKQLIQKTLKKSTGFRGLYLILQQQGVSSTYRF